MGKATGEMVMETVKVKMVLARMVMVRMVIYYPQWKMDFLTRILGKDWNLEWLTDKDILMALKVLHSMMEIRITTSNKIWVAFARVENRLNLKLMIWTTTFLAKTILVKMVLTTQIWMVRSQRKLALEVN